MVHTQQLQLHFVFDRWHVAPLFNRFSASQLKSSDRNGLENTLHLGEGRATHRNPLQTSRRNTAVRPPQLLDHHSAQAPLMLPRPAAGAAQGVDDARASDLPTAHIGLTSERMRRQEAQRSSRQQ